MKVGDLPDRSAQPDSRRATVSLVVDGWPDDVRTCVAALLEHAPDDVGLQVLDIGNVDGAGDVAQEYADGVRVTVWQVDAPVGWGAARRALLRADTARIHVWCDLSTVLDGDALTPLLDAIDGSPDVAGAGWRGADVDVADEWRSFADAGPGEVDALLGYLFAMRRATALATGGPSSKVRFYRNADLEFSFALRTAAREAGTAGRLVVPPGDLPVHQTRHRGYHDTDPTYRDAESAKNYRRLLQRYRGHDDLLVRRTGSA